MPRMCCAVVLLLSPIVSAQQDVCIDTAWMSARSMIGQNDPALAESLTETLKPGETGLYSLQWPAIASESLWFTGERGTWTALAPHDYRHLIERYETHLTEDGLLDATGLVDWPESLREGFDYETASTGENAVVNAYYYGALNGFARLMEGIGRTPRPYAYRADLVRKAFQTRLIDPVTGLVNDAPNSAHASVHANAIAAAFGLVPDASREAIAEFLLGTGMNTHPYLRPYVLEGLFRLGHIDEAMALADTYAQTEHPIDTRFLTRRYALGLRPERAGWKGVRIAPTIDPAFPRALSDKIDLPTQRLTVAYTPAVGIQLTVAPHTPVTTINDTGLSIMVKNAISHELDPLTDAQHAQLEAAGWNEQVGADRGVWVDVDTQMIRVVDDGRVIYQARCATAENGVGSENGSLKTPSGWHVVAKTYGADAAWGQVFKSRQPTRQVWKPGDDVTEDLVLTRVLHLDGLEPGHNKGGNVDSFARNIYIHGTNGEALIGTPSSHGCIRMLNDDVIDFFPLAPVGTKVLITGNESEPAQPASETD